MSLRKKIIYVLIAFIGSSGILFAQPERSINNEGVDNYNKKNFIDAEVNFRKGVEKAPDNFISNFNLGDAFYKQEKYDEAIRSFQSALAQANDDLTKAKVHHNIGNSLLKSNKIQESIEAYKNALKLNPNDQDTKYNLSYALSLLKDKQDQQQQNQNNHNQDQQNQDQNQNQNQQNQDKQQQNNQQQNPNPQNQESQQDNLKQQQPKEQKISKEEAQRILDALKNNEKDLQKELRKKTGRVRKTDKDW